MASINKSDMSKDRRGAAGKGDLHSNGMSNYREGAYWGRSNCCSAPVMVINEFSICEECNSNCNRVR